MLTVRNNKGFSLIEMMIALVIIAITLLAMLAAFGSSISVNLSNDLRNTAVRLTNQTAEVVQSLAFTDAWVVGNTTTGIVYDRDDLNSDQSQKGFPRETQSVRGFQRSYTVQWRVLDLSDNLKEVRITVSYTDPKDGTTITNDAVIYKHKAL